MLRRLQDYIARRKAQITAKRLAHATGKAPGVMQGGARFVDRGPQAEGFVTIQTRDVGEDGEAPCDCDARGVGCSHWVNTDAGGNLVVTQAERIMAQMAIGAANSALSYVELGDPAAPATTPQLSDLGLEQSTGERKTATLTAVGNIVTAEVTWTSAEANGFTFTEAGLFNGLLGAGLMFARKTFGGIPKTAAFEMRFTWLISFLVNTQGGDCAGVSLIGPSTVSAFTVYNAGDATGGVGLEASVSATFDFVVGANHVDVFLNGLRLVPGVHYNEANAPLVAPIGGPPLNKGVNFNGFVLTTLPFADQVFLIQRTLA